MGRGCPYKDAISEMVSGSGINMNKSQEIFKLLEDTKDFIIAMNGKDVKDAILRIIQYQDSIEGASILAKKEGYITFVDHEKRSIGDLLGVVGLLLEKDPRFRDPNYKLVGVFEPEPGKFIFFGKGEE